MIRNVKVSGTVQATDPALAGGLVGQNNGTIVGSAANATVSGNYAVGGLVGYNMGNITHSVATGTAVKYGQTTSGVGGLVGEDYQATITSSSADATVKADYAGNVGGLVGLGSYDTIQDSSSSSAVHGVHGSVGGLIGYLYSGTINRSFATGTVAAETNNSVGGFTGGACSCIGAASIEDSYATGKVKTGASGYAGGFAGSTFSSIGATIERSYSIGSVSGGESTGGLIGYDGKAGDLFQTYWNLDTSGISDPSQGAGNPPDDPGINGLTDVQLKSGLPKGFDPKILGSRPRSTTAIRICSPIRRSSARGGASTAICHLRNENPFAVSRINLFCYRSSTTAQSALY